MVMKNDSDSESEVRKACPISRCDHATRSLLMEGCQSLGFP